MDSSSANYGPWGPDAKAIYSYDGSGNLIFIEDLLLFRSKIAEVPQIELSVS
jgi:hypothetical protein